MLKLTIIGNLGSDPEMRYSQNGSPMLRFNVASNGRSKNAAGEWVDQPHRCRPYGRSAPSRRPGQRAGLITAWSCHRMCLI